MKPPDPPTFEWDESKNKRNIAKRGLDFADAQYIFDNPVLRKVDNREDYGEVRFIAFGEIKGHVVAVVYTMRKENYRIISFRRARRNERKAYYSWSQRYEK